MHHATHKPAIPTFLFIIVILALASATVPALKNLPLSKHAQKGHEGQAWNAVKIQSFMDAGKCKPIIYACPNEDIQIKFCEIDPKRNYSIGLVIGLTRQIILTGFAAKTQYWENRCH